VPTPLIKTATAVTGLLPTPPPLPIPTVSVPPLPLSPSPTPKPGAPGPAPVPAPVKSVLTPAGAAPGGNAPTAPTAPRARIAQAPKTTARVPAGAPVGRSAPVKVGAAPVAPGAAPVPAADPGSTAALGAPSFSSLLLNPGFTSASAVELPTVSPFGPLLAEALPQLGGTAPLLAGNPAYTAASVTPSARVADARSMRQELPGLVVVAAVVLLGGAAGAQALRLKSRSSAWPLEPLGRPVVAQRPSPRPYQDRRASSVRSPGSAVARRPSPQPHQHRRASSGPPAGSAVARRPSPRPHQHRRANSGRSPGSALARRPSPRDTQSHPRIQPQNPSRQSAG